jgi:hypothetical protein
MGAPGDASVFIKRRVMFDPSSGWSKAKSSPASATALSAATSHRIDQQIKRAFRHTYNAEAGLRMLVGLGAAEMLRAGATREAVRDALLARVEGHKGSDKPSLLTGESRSEALAKMVSSWCDEVCDRSGVADGATS